jgi:hypothetical protein
MAKAGRRPRPSPAPPPARPPPCPLRHRARPPPSFRPSLTYPPSHPSAPLQTLLPTTDLSKLAPGSSVLVPTANPDWRMRVSKTADGALHVVDSHGNIVSGPRRLAAAGGGGVGRGVQALTCRGG